MKKQILVSQISDEKVIELFRKYEKETVEKLINYGVEERTCKLEDNNLDVVGIWDEIFCIIQDKDFLELLFDGIENSIGVEEYGFIIDEDDE